MPEICFYEPWTYQLSLPEKIEAYLKFAKKKRISYEAEDCSRYNTRTNGKSAKLHPPTLAAIFKLLGMKEKEEGAAGIKVCSLFLPGILGGSGTLCHDVQLSKRKILWN